VDLKPFRLLQRYPLSLLTALLFLLYFAAYFWIPELHRKLVVEDELGENGQFLLYLAASVFFFIEGRASEGARRIRSLVLALGSLLLAGEEVSWFTRLFGYEWTWLSSKTTQGSADFHNLVDLYGKRWIYVAFFLVQATAVPVLEKLCFPRAGGNVFARKDHVTTMAVSALVAWVGIASDLVFVFEFSELVFALALCLASVREKSWRAQVAVGLACLGAGQAMVALGAGDSTVLNYGGFEYGRRGGP
jgi:hypothetical protein